MRRVQMNEYLVSIMLLLWNSALSRRASAATERRVLSLCIEI